MKLWRSRTAEIVRLEIDPVIARADALVERIETELPTHPGLARVARSVARSARQARQFSIWQQRMWGLHRLPAAFLALSLLLFAGWIYWNFIHIARLRVAVPSRDAIELHQSLASQMRLEFIEVPTDGSRENVALVAAGKVDLAFVQGGIAIPTELPRREAPSRELVLLLVRSRIKSPTDIRTLLTSVEGQGSHTVAQDFIRIWKIDRQVRYVHEWSKLSGAEPYEVPPQVDAVLVIKDPADEPTWRAVDRLLADNFRLMTPELGVRGLGLQYLRPAELPRGFFQLSPPVPAESMPTYSVATYLVTRVGLTPRLIAAAGHLVEQRNPLAEQGFEPTVSDASEMLQGLDSFLSVLIYIGLAFLALLGLETLACRKRFDELNTLVSLISMHQSARDVLGLSDAAVFRDNLLYLRLCSDLLGLIGVVTGFYTQENSSLLYSNISETIHERSSSLKVNIQLKILHASIDSRPAEKLQALPAEAADYQRDDQATSGKTGHVTTEANHGQR